METNGLKVSSSICHPQLLMLLIPNENDKALSTMDISMHLGDPSADSNACSQPSSRDVSMSEDDEDWKRVGGGGKDFLPTRSRKRI